MGKELEAICRLVESHAVILRQQILQRCVKTELRKTIVGTQQSYELKSSYVEFNLNDKKAVVNLKSTLFDMPQGEVYRIHFAQTLLYILIV